MALAIENAREGCVRETFAAPVAHRHAHPALRPIFARIARDETPTPVVVAARPALQVEDPHPTVQRILGVPSAAVARHLAERLSAALPIRAWIERRSGLDRLSPGPPTG